MPKRKITHFFRFSRVKIKEVSVSADCFMTLVKLEPDGRFLPVCSGCHKKVRRIHSYENRAIRDLPMSESMVIINLRYRNVRCPDCGIRVEHHDFVAPYARYTHRLATLVFKLCEDMSLSKVSELLNLSWDQVKNIDHSELRKRYANIDLSNLRILTIDEISFRKHHKYLTIIANFETGEVIGVVENRDYDALANFLKKIPLEVRQNIEAVAIDMWDPFIKAVKDHLPNALIVFDLFHVVAAFGRVINKIRNHEFRKADPQMKKIMKRSRYLLLKNAQNLNDEEQPRLKEILQNNQALATAYILKDYLKRLWQYKSRSWAVKFLIYWCNLAKNSGIELLQKFIKTLIQHAYGIINHCDYPIHTGKLEGINNKIKVIKRKAYGYHDLQYFGLKIMHATSS